MQTLSISIESGHQGLSDRTQGRTSAGLAYLHLDAGVAGTVSLTR